MQNLGPDSALARSLNPEAYAWASTQKTNLILADIWDLLATINANIVAVGSGKPTKNPKRYPRPGAKKPDDEQHFGSKGLPPDELRQWFDKKRAEYARSSTGDHNRHSGDGRSTGKNND